MRGTGEWGPVVQRHESERIAAGDEQGDREYFLQALNRRHREPRALKWLRRDIWLLAIGIARGNPALAGVPLDRCRSGVLEQLGVSGPARPPFSSGRGRGREAWHAPLGAMKSNHGREDFLQNVAQLDLVGEAFAQGVEGRHVVELPWSSSAHLA